MPQSQLPQNLRPAPPPLHQQYFSRAVGGPAPRARSAPVPQNLGVIGELPPSPVHQLRWICELQGLGVPLYNIEYHHTGPDAALFFSYKVAVPALPTPLCGVVHILPGTSSSNIEAEVHQTVATQILRAMGRAQMP